MLTTFNNVFTYPVPDLVFRRSKLSCLLQLVSFPYHGFRCWYRFVKWSLLRRNGRALWFSRLLLQMVGRIERLDITISRRRRRHWLVDISIPPPSFNPVALFLSRFPLSKIPKQGFFNPIKYIWHLLLYLLLFYDSTFFRLGLKHWVFMSVKQLSLKKYQDYYIVQKESAWPPASGWSGSDVDSTYSLGASPNPTISVTASGW